MVPFKILKKFDIENEDQLTNNNNYTYAYNCWGFTRFVYEKGNLYWEASQNMEEWLASNTRKIKKLKIGDIGVMKNYSSLTHTFIIVNPKQNSIIHKCGARPLSYGTIEEERKNGNLEGYGKIVEYRRFKKKRESVI